MKFLAGLATIIIASAPTAAQQFERKLPPATCASEGDKKADQCGPNGDAGGGALATCCSGFVCDDTNVPYCTVDGGSGPTGTLAPTPGPTTPWQCPASAFECTCEENNDVCQTHADCVFETSTLQCSKSGGSCVGNDDCSGNGNRCHSTTTTVQGTCLERTASPTISFSPTSSPVPPTPPPTAQPTNEGESMVPSPSCIGGDYSCFQNSLFGGSDTSKWNLDLQIEALPGGSIEAYKTAKDKWQSLIVGNLAAISASGLAADQCAGNPYPAVIDDLHICGRDEVIDGTYGILGSAGPSYVRTGTGNAITGNMRFDIADIAWMVNDGSWESVILHEMGHVIGIGSLWAYAGVVGPGPQYPYYGAAGAAVWQNDWGCSGAPPVETDGGGGVAGGHFDEDCLVNELMTGYLNSGMPNPCSKLTAATLNDLGYTVDNASPFIDPTYDGTSVASGCGCPGGRRNLRNNNDSARNLQGQGQGRRPISPEGLAKAKQYGQSVLAKNKLPPGLARETEDGAVYVGDLFVGVLYEEEGEIYGVHVTADEGDPFD